MYTDCIKKRIERVHILPYLCIEYVNEILFKLKKYIFLFTELTYVSFLT